jgi:uncharacterized protein (DUF58 family)
MGNLAGAHKSPMYGFAVEFASHREYVPGDDPKHIDWRVYFTRDKYFIKQYEMETNLVCHLLLDASASMLYGEGEEQKLRYAQRMLATLGHAIVRQSDKVSLGVFDDRVRGTLPPSNSMAQILRMTETLDRTKSQEKTRLGACLTELGGRTGRREIVLVFSDFFTDDLNGLEQALQRLRYYRHEVVLVQVLHHHELTFDFDGMIKFIGLEDADEFVTQTEDIRRGYLAEVERFNNEFERICQRNNCERILVDTSRDMAEVLVGYLNARTAMKRIR